MVVKGDIELRLKVLVRQYNLASKSKDKFAPLYISKLAIIELGGWVEESIDEIFIEFIKKNVKDPNLLQGLIDAVDSVHGFKGDSIKKIMTAICGQVGCAKLLKTVDQKKWQPLIVELKNLSKSRNSVAHTTVAFKGSTKTINAPTTTLAHLRPIYLGLRDLNKAVNKIRL